MPLKCVEDWRERRKIVEAIIANTVVGKKYQIPSIGSFIFGELASAAIEYAGGNPEKMLYSKRFGDEKFEFEVSKQFKEEIAKTNGKITPKIKSTIEKVLDAHFDYVPRDGNHIECELYSHTVRSTGIIGLVTSSKFPITQDVIQRGKDYTKTLAPEEAKDVECIGQMMRKYMEEDLVYIKKEYGW